MLDIHTGVQDLKAGEEITQSFGVTFESFACCGLVLSLQKDVCEGEETISLLYESEGSCTVLTERRQRRLLCCAGFPRWPFTAESSCQE